MPSNPFYLKALPDVADALFCNRVDEIAALVRMAESKNDVVIYAPRRYGKTSLVRRVQRKLAAEGAITVFTDFNGVASVNDVATRLATAVYGVTHGNDSLWKKAIRLFTSFRPVIRYSTDGTDMSMEITAEAAAGRTGMELLEAVMRELHDFVRESEKLVNIVFDEFQELVVLPGARNIEAVMRTHIQQYQASHFFVGSRRRLLQNMFNDEQRPFFRSALNYELKGLPEAELAPFLVNLFATSGKELPGEHAKYLVRLVKCHPHYTIKLGYHVFESAERDVSMDDVHKGLVNLLYEDQRLFESMIQAIPPQQRLLLRALAKEPTDKLMSRDYLKKHDIGSTSAIAHSTKQLSNLDYIEEGDDKIWRVVDPVFSLWLGAGETLKLSVVSKEPGVDAKNQR
jgi:hypothetical protein